MIDDFILDTTFLAITYGSKDTWSDLMRKTSTDLFSIGIGDTEETLAPITALVSRIKQGKRCKYNCFIIVRINGIGIND